MSQPAVQAVDETRRVGDQPDGRDDALELRADRLELRVIDDKGQLGDARVVPVDVDYGRTPFRAAVAMP